jgi:hypothetical protein
MDHRLPACVLFARFVAHSNFCAAVGARLPAAYHPLFPQPAAQDKSGAQSHEHRFGWVLLDIFAYFRLPRFRAGLGIRPCISRCMLELRGRRFCR